MSDMAAWDTGTDSEALRRVHIIDDLLGAVLLLAAAAFVTALELTRRQVCAVYQLAFALCASWAFFLVGGLVDHHVSDDQLSRALYGSYLSSTQYTYVPIAVSALVSLALALQLSSCDGCECCCVAVSNLHSGSSTSTAPHKQCFEGRIRSQASLYIGSSVALFVAIGTRLNVRLRGSAINPVGGTVHWIMLRSPCFLSVIHTSAVVLIALKLFLQHADKAPLHGGYHFRRLSSLSSFALEEAATPVDDLMRPQPLKKTPPLSRHSTEPKTTLTRSPRSTSSLMSSASSTAAALTPPDAPATSKSKTVPPEPPRRVPAHKGATALSQRPREPEHLNGDVSSLISSDSENDEDVLQPSFKSTGPNSHAPPIHYHNQQQQQQLPGTKPRAVSAKNSRQASSPPASPVSTASSSSSAFSFSSMASSSGAPARQRMRTARPRSSSNVSSTSTINLLSSSDSDDVSSFDGRSDYYSDRPSSASSSSFASHGLRRRAAPAQILTVHGSSTMSAPTALARASEWLECFDPVSRRVYYYSQVTGESRWER